MFDLAQLRCFTALATELNFRRAAERLNMTQPPLSRQIQLLEHQLGVALFTRSTRTVALTAAGRAFFVDAQALLEQAHRATQTARLTALGERGTVGIGFVASAVYDFLPRVVTQARHERPGVQIALQEMSTFEQLQALHARRIDLAIVRAPLNQPGLISERLVCEPFILAVPCEHALATREPLTLPALHGQPFILYAHAAWQPFNELLTGMFRSSAVQPDYVQSLGNTLTILSLVNAGMGLALVPRSASAVSFKRVCWRAIELPRGVHSELHLAWREDNDNPAVAALRDAVRQSARDAAQAR
ncbi:LysR family transcriptional regulator [Stutzerimonas stutzeri]|uniref:LysR family transcriptional regulator n=1 Tax=Stutzerimonas stutzeri TaxID=316 RepID=A0A6I6LPZ3_STUST|nr:LysR family transcriptional regulator [Stutzerimonas stutzeri]QGZ31250.1 LysR family transcriptional regulator [Stutzerimonas stutzeri]